MKPRLLVRAIGFGAVDLFVDNLQLNVSTIDKRTKVSRAGDLGCHLTRKQLWFPNLKHKQKGPTDYRDKSDGLTD